MELALMDSLSKAWELVKKEWLKLALVNLGIIAVFVVYFAIAASTIFISPIIYAFLAILSIVPILFVETALYRGYKAYADGSTVDEAITIARATPGSLVWKYFLTSLLTCFAIIVAVALVVAVLVLIALALSSIFSPLFGLLLYPVYIVVIFYLAARLSFIPYVAVFEDLGVVDSFKAGLKMTKGYVWKLVCAILLASLVMMLGYLCCGVGALVAFPVISVFFIIIYEKLVAASKAQAE